MRKLLCITIWVAFAPYLSHAVRPFITDDARVVGWRWAQLESWLRFDTYSSQMWNMAAFGPHKRLELSLGMVSGYSSSLGTERKFSYALPLVQSKFLIRPYEAGKGPGFALITGSFLPGGKGGFVPAGYGLFSFLAISQCFGKGEKVLIHVNLGVNYFKQENVHNTVYTWGVGNQTKLYKGLHLAAEFFSGDPYIPGSGVAYQAGFRYFVSNYVQCDATIGSGVSGTYQLPFWYGLGLRFVTAKWSKNKE